MSIGSKMLHKLGKISRSIYNKSQGKADNTHKI